ncbi:hypothetical protein K2Z84_32805 [Candidatus Binatia bacterium]|nr:hypothetical protein [Candidatus Binatia bacterium]
MTRLPARNDAPTTRCARRSILTRVLYTSILSLLLLPAAAAHAANPTPAQLFYVPFPEDQLLQGLQSINASDPRDPVTTYVSIAAVADGTILYYDQWENGYDADIANPANLYANPGNLGGTQIWGDGNPANGAPPGLPSDLIDAGTVIVLKNDVTSTNLTAIDFDGRDKIAATKTVAVTHTGWAAGSGTLLAGSVEVFDTNSWGTDYRMPVGIDIPDATDHQMFEFTSLAIQAGEGGATVQIDKEGDGTFESTVTLAEGASTFVNGGVEVGGHVVSDKPVQVHFLTGDVGSNYESRDSQLLPTNLWTSSYYTPVSTASTGKGGVAGAGTTVWLYNPGASALSVQYTTRSGGGSLTTTTLSVPAGGYLPQIIPDGFGAHFASAGLPFYAFSTTNSTDSSTGGNQAWDWGFTLIPDDSLTPQVLIGLGIGRDPSSNTNPDEDGNPVWVTPVGNGETPVSVYVDYDADPATGALTDLYGNHYDVLLSLKELERAKIYDDGDGDQTGVLIYVLEPGVQLAAAWGQDPLTATASAPGLDVGTGVPPLPLFAAGKNGLLFTDNDGDGYASPGDVLLYTIALTNISRAPVPDLKLADPIPAGTTYVAGSTTFKNSAGVTTPVPDDGSGTAFPLDGAGKILDDLTALPVSGSYEVTYKVSINAFASLPSGTSSILNVCSASALGVTVGCRDTTPLYGRIGDFVWLDVDGDGVQDGGAETGIGGVTINLYTDLNGNGVIDGGDSIVATKVTSAAGAYLFTGVPAGKYVVDVAGGAALTGLTLTTANDPKAVTLAGGEWRLDVDFGYRNLCVQPNGQPVVCNNGGECSDPGTCQPATGLCSAAVPKGNGSSCTDDGNACTVDRCQSGSCTHTAGNAGVVCRAATGACDVAETCTGAGTTCPADGFATSATVCRPANGACDLAETCTGTGPACPADGVKPSGTQCRAAAGACDVAESCNGASAACPNDGFVAAATTCRAATGQCDVAEVCTGLGAACPSDTVKPNGSSCSDGDLCTTDSCQAGSCVAGPPVQCTALDQCHLPGACNPSTGQCSNPNAPDGTQCSDGDACSAGDQCEAGLCTGTTALCEMCHDLEDDDGDGLIDCLDPDCPICPQVVDTCHHPCVTQVVYQRIGLDLLRLQASFKPFTPIDPASEQVGLLITNANGVVFADLLGPGTVKRVGKSWVATVKSAKTAGGIFKLRFLRLADGTYRVNFKAYGAIEAKATLPTMTVQIVVGDDVAVSTENWETIKNGWRVQLQ